MVNRSRRGPVRWGLVIIITIVGVGVIGTAFLVENDQGVWPDLLVNAGTTITLFGALAVLERRFVADVTEGVREASREVASKLEERFETRLDEIQNQVNQRLRKRDEADDDLVKQLALDVSHKTVIDLLTTANQLGAIYDGIVTVPGNADLDGPRLTFKWGIFYQEKMRTVPMLIVEAEKTRWHWRPEASAAEFGVEFTADLRRRGLQKRASALDWNFVFSSLQHALRVALNSRRDTPGAWHMKGALRELVGGELAITSAGIESRTHGLVVEAHRLSRFIRKVRREEPPEPPAWADPDEFRCAVERAEPVHLLSGAWIEKPAGTTQWVPWEGENTQGDLRDLPPVLPLDDVI